MSEKKTLPIPIQAGVSWINGAADKFLRTPTEENLEFLIKQLRGYQTNWIEHQFEQSKSNNTLLEWQLSPNASYEDRELRPTFIEDTVNA